MKFKEHYFGLHNISLTFTRVLELQFVNVLHCSGERPGLYNKVPLKHGGTQQRQMTRPKHKAQF